MHDIVRTLAVMAALSLAACTSADPGPLEGTWTATEPFPVTVSFRDGEVEAMGRVRAVTYTVEGDEVLVTYRDAEQGSNRFRYTVVDADTLQSSSGTFHRVR